MKKKILVSVIINCYNGEKYLRDCIESVLSQTYANWELILFDNLSKDNSSNIFLSYNDNRFKYFKSNSHLTLSEARNQAFLKSNGDWICFLDVDDYWHKKKIEYQIDLINDDIGLIYGSTEIVYEETLNSDFNKINRFRNQVFKKGNIHNSLLIKNFIPFCSTIAMKLAFFTEIF